MVKTMGMVRIAELAARTGSAASADSRSEIQAGQMIGSIANKRRKLFVHWHQSNVGAFA
jgi:hypothetical protein